MYILVNISNQTLILIQLDQDMVNTFFKNNIKVSTYTSLYNNNYFIHDCIHTDSVYSVGPHVCVV